jgi:3-hydroxy-3-methylglutaryl CoA synthase
MIGLTAFGAYIPRLRLSRRSIVDAHRWNQPGLARLGKGERAMCNWDEDSLTMAVEAARDCLEGMRDSAVPAVYLGSTTLPFEDRQNAGILGAALGLGEDVRTADVTSSQRAGTSALMAALEAARGGDGGSLVVASDQRRTKAGAAQELQFGDGAAAFTVGREGVVARLLGMHTLSVDFVDHYRGANREFDYNWEERWIRDEGFLKIVPRAISKALADAGVEADRVSRLILSSILPRAAEKVAGSLGIPADRLADSLHAGVGEAGAAHSLLMLAHALETAGPGEVLVVASFGQGCDVLVFETTEAIAELPQRRGVQGSLARRREETNYNKFLAFNGLIEREKGMRAEVDNQTALTQLYRRREMLLGLVGGTCDVCGTRQFPKSRVCVNPNCNAMNSQSEFRFSEVPARIVTWSADHLTYCPDPPLHYGMVQFDGGGRIFANFTDVDVGNVEVGQRMRMMFRVKDFDDQRGFRRYFWKAAPEFAPQAAASASAAGE